METLYGKYPKKIICQCNAGEMDAEADTILLNDRCPVCHSVRRICIPKAEVRMKAISGIKHAHKAQEEPVLKALKEIEPLIVLGQALYDHFDHSFYYFSYFTTLPGRFWIYTWASLIPSSKMPQRKS